MNRLETVVKSGVGEVAAIADPSREMAARAGAIAPRAALKRSLDELLASDLDGLVIATPSALHAEQAVAALERGVAVFCQKPLGRNAHETATVMEAARRADRLLGVDLSYRHLAGSRRVKELVRQGELGRIYAVELAFHNAYGPGKAWFYDRKLSGGGCVIDLGIHLVDLALWTLEFPETVGVSSRLFAGGEPWHNHGNAVEDYATARVDLASGTAIQLACSWKLAVGMDAIIHASFYGTHGGAAVRNVNGSFYEFVSERFQGTHRETLTSGSESWGGGALVAWAEQLGRDPRFDPKMERLTDVARVLDGIYSERQL